MSGELGPEMLARAGVALYGARWQTDLARALGIRDARRIRQWMSRERPIPSGVWGDIAQLLEDRGNNAISLSKAIRSKGTGTGTGK